MEGRPGSKHWAEDSIYKLLSDEKHHTFQEVYETVVALTGRDIRRSTLSAAIQRLKKKNENIVSDRAGVFRYIDQSVHINY